MDTITFKNVIPIPLLDAPMEGNVWRSDLSLQRGNKYLVMADSGRGKSTMLNIIYGIRKDYQGDVLFNDLNIKKMLPDAFSPLRSATMAYLFQDLRLFHHLTARENIALKPGCKFNNAEINYYAEKIGVESLLEKKCATLSLGQQQRIAMLRAISQSFTWLLLDEPFSHLDSTNAHKMMELVLQRCAEENAGIIATSLGDTKGFDSFQICKL